MKQSNPSMQEWEALYKAAIEFRKIEPWEWMRETDIFGVQNPQTGEIGYCCILGELGEVLAMAVYRGTEGLQGYLKILKGKIRPGDLDAPYIQDCLLSSFENKQFIEKEAMKIINELKLKFSGRNSWPLFRSYKPGYFPWFLNRDEVLYLTFALQQARDVCLRVNKNSKLLRPPKRNLYLIRVPEARDGTVVWKDEWREPACMKQKRENSEEAVDEIRIQRIKKTVNPNPMLWEIDFFHTPTPVSQGARPFFPYAIMLVDHDTGFILDMYLSESDEYRREFPDKFLSCIEKTSVLPLEILVRKEEALKLLMPSTSRLNIKLSMVKKLPNIDHARREMVRHLKEFR